MDRKEIPRQLSLPNGGISQNTSEATKGTHEHLSLKPVITDDSNLAHIDWAIEVPNCVPHSAIANKDVVTRNALSFSYVQMFAFHSECLFRHLENLPLLFSQSLATRPYLASAETNQALQTHF